MSKKIAHTPPTKLIKYQDKDQIANSAPQEEGCGFILQNKNKKVIKTFRLSSMDVELLNGLTLNVNKGSRYKKYSEAEILRCMIHFCASVPIEKLIKHF